MPSENTETTDIQERFKHLLEVLNHSANSFARLVGVNPSMIVNVVSGRNKPGADTLSRMALAVPKLNIDWLLTGRGEALRPSSNDASNATMVAGNGNITQTGKNNQAGKNNRMVISDLNDCTQQLEHWKERAKTYEALANDRQTIIELMRKTTNT